MKTLHNLLVLKRLYSRKACGEAFCDEPNLQNFGAQVNAQKALAINGGNIPISIKDCASCRLHRYTNIRVPGHLGANTQICFVTKTPLIEPANHAKNLNSEMPTFIQNKSAQMLENIIKKVFCLDSQNFSLLWLVKCQTHDQEPPLTEDVQKCLHFLHSEFAQIAPKITIIFGNECAKYMLAGDFESGLGRVLWHNQKAFLITHAISDLVRNPSLKPQAMQHFKAAMSFLQ